MQMSVSSSLTVQVAYYNSEQALWEPLIEPVEQVKDGKIVHCPWELRADVSFISKLVLRIKVLLCQNIVSNINDC
jgi:hypothetical protein